MPRKAAGYVSQMVQHPDGYGGIAGAGGQGKMVDICRDIDESPRPPQPFLCFAQARLGIVEQDHLIVAVVKIGQPAKPGAKFDNAAALRRQQVA